MFMLRSTHEAIVAQKDAEFARAMTLVDRAHARLDATIDKYAALLEAKAAPPPVPPPRVKREPDAADTAIEWAAQGDMQRRRHLERWAKGERSAGREASAIADEIMRGTRAPDADDDDGVPA